jgi:hypothetical protein
MQKKLATMDVDLSQYKIKIHQVGAPIIKGQSHGKSHSR